MSNEDPLANSANGKDAYWRQAPNAPAPSIDSQANAASAPYGPNMAATPYSQAGAVSAPFGSSAAATPYGQANAAPAPYGPANAAVNAPLPATAQYVAPSAAQSGDGKATGALICGILSLVFCYIPLVGGVLAIVAIVLAILAKRAGTTKGTRTAGLVMGIIGVLLGLLFTIITLWAVFLLSDELAQSGYDIDQLVEELDSEWDDSAGGGQSLSGSFDDPDDQAAYDAAVAVLDVVCDPDDEAVQNLANAIDASFEEESGVTLSDAGIDPVELVEWITADASYDITDLYTFSDGTGTVYYTAHVHDLEALMDSVGDKLDAYRASDEFEQATSEEKHKKFGEIMHEAMGEVSEMEDRTAWLDMQEFDDKWAPTRESLDSLANDFYGTYWG